MLFALAYVAVSVPHSRRLLWGAALVALGEALRFWAAGHLQRNQVVARGGPYAWVRHPLYLGSFIIGVGLALAAEAAGLWLAAFLVLYAAFYLPAMHVEELRLQSLFGAEYQEYMGETRRLLPRLRRVPRWPEEPVDSRFCLRRAMDNREGRSALAMAGLVLLQAAKLL